MRLKIVLGYGCWRVLYKRVYLSFFKNFICGYKFKLYYSVEVIDLHLQIYYVINIFFQICAIKNGL